MTQVFYIPPYNSGALPRICQASKCLNDTYNKTNFCESHQHLARPIRKTSKYDRKRVIYMIRIEGVDGIKIGYTANLESRLSSIQSGNPNKVVLIAAFEGRSETERMIHKELKAYNIRGEWFYDKVVEKFIIDLFYDKKLRESYRIIKTLAISDKMRYIIADNEDS